MSTLRGDDVIVLVRRIRIDIFEVTIQLIGFIDIMKTIEQYKLCNFLHYVIEACEGLF